MNRPTVLTGFVILMIVTCVTSFECSCPPGEYVKVPCKAMISAVCENCKPNTYNGLRDTSTSCDDCLRFCYYTAEVVSPCTPISNLRCKCKEGYMEQQSVDSMTSCILRPIVKSTEQVVTNSSNDRLDSSNNFTKYTTTAEDLKSLHKNGARCSGSLPVLTVFICIILVLLYS